MPFTASHPAIVLPASFLPAKYYSLTGLIMGSVVPDFEYFIRLKIYGIYGHTLGGLFFFDLPLALLLCFLFHEVYRNSIILNLPAFFQKRLYSFTTFNWVVTFKKRWPIILISILIGSFSHIFWDSFTHNDGYFVHNYPLVTGFIPFAGKNWPLFYVFQHTSTVLGGLAIFYAIYKLPITENNEVQINSRFWLYGAGLSLAIFTVRFLWTFEYEEFTSATGNGWSLGLGMGLGDFVVSIIGSGLWGYGVVSVLFGKLRKQGKGKQLIGKQWQKHH